MKDRKRRIEQFLFYDARGIEEHLMKMALKGWQIHKINNFYWEYRKITPQRLNYTVTYFSEASDFNPYPTRNQQTFHDYCRSAGWELVAEWAQMQIFCTREEDPIPIETEESVTLQAIHKAMKKNFLPGHLALLFLSLFQIIMQLYMIFKNPVEQLTNNSTLSLLGIWSIILIHIIIVLTGYGIWYRRSRKAIAMGISYIKNGGYQRVSLLIWAFVIATFLLGFLSMIGQHAGWAGIVGIVYVTLLLAIIFMVKNRLKRARVSKGINITVTIVTTMVLSIVLTGVMFFGIISGVRSGWFGRKDAEGYTAKTPYGITMTWKIYKDNIPLKVEDLQDVEYEHYSYELTKSESLVLARSSARQRSFPDGSRVPELSYEIIHVKVPFLYQLCLKEYLDRADRDWEQMEAYARHFKRTEQVTWQADEVYQVYDGEEARGTYLICWGSQFVYLSLDEVPTKQQIAVITEKLRYR